MTAEKQYTVFSSVYTGCNEATGIIHLFPGGIFIYSQEDKGSPQNTSISPPGSESSDLNTVKRFLHITTLVTQAVYNAKIIINSGFGQFKFSSYLFQNGSAARLIVPFSTSH